jgi:phospholipid/cholesterol/gamma-HCH transport system substrate-binding protein/paraquat-inducible protein B
MAEADEREDGSHHYRLGLFVVAGIAGLAVLLFVLGGRKLFQPTYTFETYFDGSVAGLEVGAPVRYRGVPLGEVTEIESSGALYEHEVPIAKRRNYIVVRAKVNKSAISAVQIEKDRDQMIRMGLRVQTQLAGISGQQYLALDYLDPEKYLSLPFDWMPEYDYVPSAPSATAQIVAGAQQLMAKLAEVDVERLSTNLDNLLVKLDKAIDSLQVADLSADARKVLKTTHSTLTRLDRELAKPDLARAIENIAGITADLRRVTARGDLEHLVQHLDATAARLSGLIGDNQYDARLIVEDLRVTVENLRVLSNAIKRYPGALLGGPPEKVQLPAGPSP